MCEALGSIPNTKTRTKTFKILLPVPVNVTTFGKRIFADLINLR
jgi:hypothetical protein